MRYLGAAGTDPPHHDEINVFTFGVVDDLPRGEVDAFYAQHDRSYYRVTCSPHGD